jgi:L,D-peptidoglycan transpeptidase YkuD (ErfK/YbiS/YcfS/YnhG family)
MRMLLLITTGYSLLTVSSAAAARSSPCEGRGTSVVVDLDRSRLWLCDEGEGVRSYRVAFGRAGVGKRKKGDEKTPVGTYSLGQGRASGAGFHRFLDVGYPTSSQIQAGYTGSAIGIHGPKDGWAWLGPLGVVKNWTAGCVAVASRRQIESIESWVRAESVRTVHLVSTLE